MLLNHGYNTYAIGKWHLTPADQTSAAGPYDRWPLGRGFERYYGFLGGDTHQYYPELVHDNHTVEQPKTPEEGYHLTEDLADNVNEDVAETIDLAEENRPKLIEMIGRWYAEAGKYNVFPIDSRGVMRLADERPAIAQERTSYVYRPGTQAVPSLAAAKVLNRPHSITADVVIPAGGADGVLVSHGGNDGGYSLYIKDGKLKYVHNYVALEYLEVVSSDLVPEGAHELRFEFEPTGAPDPSVGKGSPGRAQLYIDGALVGNAEFEYTTPLVFGIAGGAVACGFDGPSPVVPYDYEPPNAFTGTINTVTIDVSGELIEDDEATMRRLMAHQ